MPMQEGPKPSQKGYEDKGKGQVGKDVGMQGSGDLAKGSDVVSGRPNQMVPKRMKSVRMPLAQEPIQPKVGK